MCVTKSWRPKDIIYHLTVIEHGKRLQAWPHMENMCECARTRSTCVHARVSVRIRGRGKARGGGGEALCLSVCACVCVCTHTFSYLHVNVCLFITHEGKKWMCSSTFCIRDVSWKGHIQKNTEIGGIYQ